MSEILPFWSSKQFESNDGIALATKNEKISYYDLNLMVKDYVDFLQNLDLKNQLAFLPMEMNIQSIVKYLACLRASIVPFLMPSSTDKNLLQNLLKTYQPALVFGLNSLKDIHINNTNISMSRLPENLALLLSTSGSTGSSKLVKLSYENLYENAKSIKEYLKIQPHDIAHCSLPLSYSYGLSVLNTHLQSGGCVFLSDLTPFSKSYYDELIEENITSISGVPFFYQMLNRTGFFEKDLPSIKVMTQAGGKLGDKLVQKLSDHANSHKIKFFVMYGQTEATARISYVPPHLLDQKIGSIGIPIPKGKLSLSDDGELIYYGPNVMLGYAENIYDLYKKNSTINQLFTGDLARVDKNGYYFITGRIKRFVKLAGTRYGLDEIETYVENKFNISCIATGKDDKLTIIALNLEADSDLIISKLQDKFSINRHFIKIILVDDLVMTANGKKNYAFYREYYNGS